MKIKLGSKKSGFTIIELIIVIIIVAILVALAYPSYIKYARKAKRGDAQHLLMNWSINQELWRSKNPQYATDAVLPPPSNDNYNFGISNRTATTYTLSATAKPGNDQVNDKSRDISFDCDSICMNQNGVMLPAACWD